jgi:hypothetical protein
LKIHCNIILPSTPGSSKWFLLSGLPTKILYAPLPSLLRHTHCIHFIFAMFVYNLHAI